ncbi:unnamed protein product [Bursaphelenchus xylophilus]|uniref:(pine wood nematode) hypothetical protein n=1 Tax=Bursaphelenchus xylophilus TaxID=6326 RepID=A0A1I7RLZ9_BURXY|nr:unnamed protein product [Bursaphelenchus xylophilus]CAG9113399.1 unnamed protein product [Bursaphelenchus xylophilus]
MPDDLPRIPKKRRPRNKPRSDAWLQQNLKAYRPSFTFRCALPVIAATAVVCLGMGITLIYNNSKATEHVIDYTDCEKKQESDGWTHRYENDESICEHQFKLSAAFTGDITFYYGLDGFYQNIRKYQQSRNDNQLRGDLQNVDECFPYERDNQTKEPYVPCGAVADSMFNDSFLLFTVDRNSSEKSPVEMSALEIIPKRFRERKYRNPKPCRGNVTRCPGFERTSKPPHWTRHIAEIGDAETGRGLENADFIIWMETSALPNFRKVYRKLKVLPANDFNGGLPEGLYSLEIKNSRFSGFDKRFM